MTQYLKSAGMLRDMMRIDPDRTFDIIDDAFVESGFNDVYGTKTELGVCANTTTDEGMEMCIVQSARDISKRLDRSSDFSSDMKRILSEIDKGVLFTKDNAWK